MKKKYRASELLITGYPWEEGILICEKGYEFELVSHKYATGRDIRCALYTCKQRAGLE